MPNAHSNQQRGRGQNPYPFLASQIKRRGGGAKQCPPSESNIHPSSPPSLQRTQCCEQQERERRVNVLAQDIEFHIAHWLPPEQSEGAERLPGRVKTGTQG